MVKSLHKEEVVQGVPISQGIAIGRLVFFMHDDETIPEVLIQEGELETELDRYEKALEKTKKDIERLKKQLEMNRSKEAAAILDTHLQILEDPMIKVEVPSQIKLLKKNAEFIFHKFLKEYTKRFNEIKDPFFRERGRDLLDISRRVSSHLRKTGRSSLLTSPSGSIICSYDIAASDVAEADPSKIGGFVTDAGGVTSHAAIIAKAKGIPYVASVQMEQIEKALNTTVIIDGRSGEMILFPSEETLDKYLLAQKQLEALYKDLENSCGLKTETYDGFEVKLSGNIEMVSEIDLLHQYGGSGVGLFRSEYIFLSKQSFPSEDEQYRIYSEIISEMRGLPIVIRTFDVGGDKGTVEEEPNPKGNPYLGCRAIRFLLKEKDIFKTQLRAIIRAANRGSVSIMFPMISELSELHEARELVEEVLMELDDNESDIRLGCMIEVPSAATISDLLAKECDFLAIGTNDLVQYLLAVDRGNQAINRLYTAMHPAVLRMIKLVVMQAARHGVPVSVCGEIASDPRFTSLLLGLGVSELSVSLRNLPLIKKVIRHSSIIRSHELAEEALTLSTTGEIEALLSKEFENCLPEEFHSLKW